MRWRRQRRSTSIAIRSSSALATASSLRLLAFPRVIRERRAPRHTGRPAPCRLHRRHRPCPMAPQSGGGDGRWASSTGRGPRGERAQQRAASIAAIARASHAKRPPRPREAGARRALLANPLQYTLATDRRDGIEPADLDRISSRRLLLLASRVLAALRGSAPYWMVTLGTSSATVEYARGEAVDPRFGTARRTVSSARRPIPRLAARPLCPSASARLAIIVIASALEISRR